VWMLSSFWSSPRSFSPRRVDDESSEKDFGEPSYVPWRGLRTAIARVLSCRDVEFRRLQEAGRY